MSKNDEILDKLNSVSSLVDHVSALSGLPLAARAMLLSISSKVAEITKARNDELAFKETK